MSCDKQQKERTEWQRQGLRQKNTTSIEIGVKRCMSVEIILPQPCKRSGNEAKTLSTMTDEHTFAVAQVRSEVLIVDSLVSF